MDGLRVDRISLRRLSGDRAQGLGDGPALPPAGPDETGGDHA
jgi:hypothetical protein